MSSRPLKAASKIEELQNYFGCIRVVSAEYLRIFDVNSVHF